MSMNRRAVSPIVATVLLIAITLVLAAIIFLWGRSFLSESAVKGEKSASLSCGDVKMESEIVTNTASCSGVAELQINNLGNIPIYGAMVLAVNDNTDEHSVIFDGPFSTGGTVTVGKSARICLTGVTTNAGDKYQIVPKVLAKQGEQTIAYTCPENNAFSASQI